MKSTFAQRLETREDRVQRIWWDVRRAVAEYFRPLEWLTRKGRDRRRWRFHAMRVTAESIRDINDALDRRQKFDALLADINRVPTPEQVVKAADRLARLERKMEQRTARHHRRDLARAEAARLAADLAEKRDRLHIPTTRPAADRDDLIENDSNGMA